MKRPAALFTGELGILSLFDFSQLLMLNRASGCLEIVNGDARGFLYFAEGRLVNAVDDTMKEGEEAAYRVFAWRTGHFEFRHEAPGGSGTITSGTDAVMLEAARRIDEQASAAGEQGKPLSREQERVQRHQQAMEILRDEFQRVTGEMREAQRSAGNESVRTDLHALSLSTDRLVYRAHHPPRLRSGDSWQTVDTGPLASTAYQELRAQLLELCVREPGAAGAEARRIHLSDGRIISLDIVNEGEEEALWLRPANMPPVDPAQLEGDLVALDAILTGPEWLVLVGDLSLEGSRQLLHALLARLATNRDATLLLATDDSTYTHVDDGGVILRTTPKNLRSALRTVQPDVLAVDSGVAPGEINLEDLEPVPRVLGGVVGPHAASLTPRWLARLARRGSQRAEAVLATTTLGLVMAQPSGESDSVRFSCWQLTADERTVALGGDATILANLLGPGQRKPKLKLERR